MLHALGFDHVYFSWYFNALLTWLAVSAVICNIVRWRTTWRLWKTPQVRRGARFFAADKRSWIFVAADSSSRTAAEMPPPQPEHSASLAPSLATVTPTEVSAAIAEDLQLLGYRVKLEQDDAAQTLYADRGFAKKWALVLLHVAILILLGGGFYGAATGVKGNIRLGDGESHMLTIDIAEGKYAWVQPWLGLLPKPSYELRQQHFRIDWSRKLVLEQSIIDNVPADLQEYYRYFVHDYISELEVSHKGRTVKREVKVNHPLVIEKLVLYQSGYDQRGYLAVSGPGGTSTTRIPDPIFGADTLYALTPTGVAVQDPATGEWMVPSPSEADSYITIDPSTVSRRAFKVAENVKSGDVFHHDENVGRVGPMAIFTLRDNAGGMELGSLLVTDKAGFDTQVGGVAYNVRLSDKVDDFSVFAYKRDPGSPVLFSGWLLLVAGIALTMYVPFTQLWLRAEPGSLSVLALGPLRGRLRQRLETMLGIEEA